MPDQSRNNALFGLLAFGEGWHNNHHAFPTSARQGLRWWQVDITWWFILLLRGLKLVRNVRVPTAKAIAARRQPKEQVNEPREVREVASLSSTA